MTPFMECDLTSFVHEKLAAAGQLDAFEDNRPKGVRCVHPLVTLVEKLDNLRRRFPNEWAEAATFVRHYEDAAHIIANAARLPELAGYADARALAIDMLGAEADRCPPQRRREMPCSRRGFTLGSDSRGSRRHRPDVLGPARFGGRGLRHGSGLDLRDVRVGSPAAPCRADRPEPGMRVAADGAPIVAGLLDAASDAWARARRHRWLETAELAASSSTACSLRRGKSCSSRTCPPAIC